MLFLTVCCCCPRQLAVCNFFLFFFRRKQNRNSLRRIVTQIGTEWWCHLMNCNKIQIEKEETKKTERKEQDWNIVLQSMRNNRFDLKTFILCTFCTRAWTLQCAIDRIYTLFRMQNMFQCQSTESVHKIGHFDCN